MKHNIRYSVVVFAQVAYLAATLASVSAFAQAQYPPAQQYPQEDQDQAQYPPPQAQYPPVQGEYPPPQSSPYGQQQQYPQQYPPPQQQYQPPPPQAVSPQQLDQMVASIALYPDGLLAQVLTAATYYSEIPDAAAWANQHSYLQGPALAQAIAADRLPFDPSVVALLPFPQVLNQMANNMGWTQALGDAVLVQRPDVMDAVQRMRDEAYRNGYLRSTDYERVIAPAPGMIQIVPVTPDYYYYVPYYDPYVVFARPRPGLFVGGAIRFGPGVPIGAAFAPWGWGGVGFGWREHSILVDHRPWVRTWRDRPYVHPYVPSPRRFEGGRMEHHELRGPARYEGRYGGHHDRR